MKLYPKGWKDFQHYKDRNPPWIRLHRTLLDNFDFQRLPVASRALAPMLWLLTSESADGSIDADIEKLAFRLRQTEEDIASALKPLIDKGFFYSEESDSAALAECLRDAVPETEAETEALQKEPTVLVPDPAGSDTGYAVPICPTAEIVNAYARHLPALPQVTVLNDARKRSVSARWREVCATDRMDRAQGIEFFDWFFLHVSESEFLTGRTAPGRGKDRAFRADFDWLMCPTNFARVVEGRYHGGKAA